MGFVFCLFVCLSMFLVSRNKNVERHLNILARGHVWPRRKQEWNLQNYINTSFSPNLISPLLLIVWGDVGKSSKMSWFRTWIMISDRFGTLVVQSTDQLCTFGARSQREQLRPWQRAWGRRLGIRKGGIEPQESPWKFSSIYPQNQSLPTFCFVLSPTPLTLLGAVPHYLSLKKELTYSSS